MNTHDGKDANVPSKTPEEIKKGLKNCGPDGACKEKCPYYEPNAGCVGELIRDALAYIQQLEAQVPKWLNADGSILCPYCGSKIRMISAWQKAMPDMGGYVWCARGKCTACGSITPEMHGRTAKEANAAAYAAAQWGHVPLPEPPKEE